MAFFLYCFLLFLAIILFASLKILKEDERLVIIRLGRFFKIGGPGIVMILPLIDHGIRVNLSRDLPGWQGLPQVELDEKIRAFALNNPDQRS